MAATARPANPTMMTRAAMGRDSRWRWSHSWSGWSMKARKRAAISGVMTGASAFRTQKRHTIPPRYAARCTSVCV